MVKRQAQFTFGDLSSRILLIQLAQYCIVAHLIASVAPASMEVDSNSGAVQSQPLQSSFSANEAALIDSDSNGQLGDVLSGELDKRGWNDMPAMWGKRGWNDMPAMWGKRAWKDMPAMWGKRAWNDMPAMWGNLDLFYVIPTY